MPVRNLGGIWSLLLVGLPYQISLCAEIAVGSLPNKVCDYRKTCMGLEHDTRNAVCCGNRLHPGQGLSCCGKQAFNPGVATCCEHNQGHTSTAHVTSGLSKEVSACCGATAYNPLNEMCCLSTVLTRPSPKAKCCGKGAIDEETHLCCGPRNNKAILQRDSAHHVCCGHAQFNPKTHCCCSNHDSLQIKHSSSPCCVGNLATNPQRLKTTLQTLLGPNAMNSVALHPTRHTVSKRGPCGGDFDARTHLCCGASDNKKLLIRKSDHHQCCGHDQYDTKTQCCCYKDNGILVVHNFTSRCCGHESGVLMQAPLSQRICTEPNTSLCGTICYNPSQLNCCERKNVEGRWCCESGGCDSGPTLYDAQTHVCCDGCVSERKPWTNQFHDSPGQHCCGTDTYQPEAEICCDGHRHPKIKSGRCCGIKTYNIQDPDVKCCEGTLHNLKVLGNGEDDILCCGSLLQTPQDICCSSADKAVLYANKTGHSCCGHRYYNRSLWSCCAGSLKPLHPSGLRQGNAPAGSSLSSVFNLPPEDLCNKIRLGTVESVSQRSIVFRDVVEINGSQDFVKALPTPHVLETPDTCNIPSLTPGVMYYFNDVEVFTDFHQNPLESLYFILLKCTLSTTYG
ncbi:uncharacterized protein LOC103378087 isoform X2 [Cynoglossus semilaevis]|uniref:uncharacterized protein LOC103378087 isoform X2 n=1 Tax=Cynoglossus semilaevis TaxID=244447 RepID=UPI0007DCB606|nr:uncharacterized protein LOC103378087 isoform X2 [Cynoglossus semilaevis]